MVRERGIGVVSNFSTDTQVRVEESTLHLEATGLGYGEILIPGHGIAIAETKNVNKADERDAREPLPLRQIPQLDPVVEVVCVRDAEKICRGLAHVPFESECHSTAHESR